ncbi:MAG TPA: flagellar basal-body MS-ring/collar protein FliF [Vicinamibacterales bacterium]
MNIEQFLARLKAGAEALSGKQLVSLSLAFLAVVGLTIGSAYWLNTPNYGVLFSDMDSESASSVIAKLKEQKVLYEIDDGGRTIRVPTTRVDELRLELAGQGMPGSGHVGFEIFDKTAFGVTDFLEHVNYRRALEGELARTISTISEVAGARVHIAMPQPSLFSGRDQPTKASVILKLRNKTQLAPQTVTAITGLVSASVESLKPEAVVIIDNFGRPLSKTEDPDDASSSVGIERQQRIERELSARVINLLEPIIGAGRVRVNVTAKLNSDTNEETEEKWDPTPVVRSQQMVSQTANGVAGAAQGIAGSRTNLPPDPSKPEAAATAASMTNLPTGAAHTAETTNYEVSKLTRHSLQPRGDITKLSVAVLLDDDRPAATGDQQQAAAAKPRAAEELQKIHGLVAAAVGLDADRGDQLTVENIAFEETPVEPVVAPGAWQKYGPQVMEALRVLGIVALGALALFGVIRPIIKGSLAAGAAGTAIAKSGAAAVAKAAVSGARTVQDIEAEMDAQLSVAGPQRMPVLTKRVAALTQREPENAAHLLRTWLAEDER